MIVTGANDQDGKEPSDAFLDLRNVLALQDAHLERLQRQNVREYIAQISDVKMKEYQGRVIVSASGASGPMNGNSTPEPNHRFGQSKRGGAGDLLTLRVNVARLIGKLLIDPQETVKALDSNSDYNAVYIKALKHIAEDDPLRIHFDKCLKFARASLTFKG